MSWLETHWILGTTLVVASVIVGAIVCDARNYKNIQTLWEMQNPGKKYPGDRLAKRQLK